MSSEAFRDLQIRCGIMERELGELRKSVRLQKEAHTKLQKELKATLASMDKLAQKTDQAHNLVARMISLVNRSSHGSTKRK